MASGVSTVAVLVVVIVLILVLPGLSVTATDRRGPHNSSRAQTLPMTRVMLILTATRAGFSRGWR